MKRIFPFVLLMLGLAGRAISSEPFVAGTDYTVIDPPVAIETEAGQVSVVEVFWYGCEHCDRFEPFVRQWQQDKADYIAFSRMPGVFSHPIWQLHAAAFYTAEQLGKGEELHGPMFDAIHRQQNPLDSARSLQTLFAQYGVDEESFYTTLHSPAVRARVLRAHQLSRDYGIQGVPCMIVAGKYLVDSKSAGDYPRMLEIVDALAAQEAQAAQPAP